MLQWLNRWAPAHDDIVGMIEIGSARSPSAYFWDAEADDCSTCAAHARVTAGEADRSATV
ncbi:MAG: hypothetical protein NT151_08115 [Acidobacteria bacterium]|nr:hypothetical protein [Acidobacteriota bacterium]